MPKFAIAYHLIGNDMTPTETIDADDMQDAASKISTRFSAEDRGGAIVVPVDQEMYAIPKASVAYCHIRQVVERRRSSGINFDELDEEAGQVVA